MNENTRTILSKDLGYTFATLDEEEIFLSKIFGDYVFEDLVENKISEDEMKKQILIYSRKILKKDEYEVFSYFHGINGKKQKTLEEISKIQGIGLKEIKKIEKEAALKFYIGATLGKEYKLYSELFQTNFRRKYFQEMVRIRKLEKGKMKPCREK